MVRPRELAEEEDLYTGSGFLFLAIEEGGKDARIVGHHNVAFVDIFNEIFENTVLHLPAIAVQYQHSGFVTVARRLFGNQIFWQVEPKL